MYPHGLLLQIVEAQRDGTFKVITFPGGSKAEADLIQLCTNEIVKRGVRFHSQTHIQADIAAGIFNALAKFKAHTAGR